MRLFLDSILLFIGEATLSDQEYSSMMLTTQDYSIEVFNALKNIIESRQSVTDSVDRLVYFFLAKGVNVIGEYKPRSNILIGRALN